MIIALEDLIWQQEQRYRDVTTEVRVFLPAFPVYWVVREPPQIGQWCGRCDSTILVGSNLLGERAMECNCTVLLRGVGHVRG